LLIWFTRWEETSPNFEFISESLLEDFSGIILLSRIGSKEKHDTNLWMYILQHNRERWCFDGSNMYQSLCIWVLKIKIHLMAMMLLLAQAKPS
jgi:hypothetical protein